MEVLYKIIIVAETRKKSSCSEDGGQCLGKVDTGKKRVFMPGSRPEVGEGERKRKRA